MKTTYLFLATLLLTVGASSALALPPDQVVTYSFRQDPSDETSTVLLYMEWYISAVSGSGAQVTWSIDEFHFRQPDGATVNTWTESAPGLADWTVTHADPDNPVAADFVDPPGASGQAATNESQDPLDYDATPGTCDSQCQAKYGGDVMASAYSFVAGTLTIAEEEEEEPVEIEDEDDY